MGNRIDWTKPGAYGTISSVHHRHTGAFCGFAISKPKHGQPKDAKQRAQWYVLDNARAVERAMGYWGYGSKRLGRG